MKKEFEARLMQERIIDTKQYRYIATEEHDSNSQWLEIKRISLTKLDTTASLEDWETIKRIY